MRKFSAIILVFLTIMNSVIAFAEGTIEDYENSANNKILINASTFVESGVESPAIYTGQSSQTEYMSTDRKVLVFSGSNAMFGYDVEIVQSGTYEVVAYIASKSTLTVSLLLNGEEMGRGNLNAQPSYSHYTPVNLGNLDLEAGTNRIGVKNYTGGGSQLAFLTVECIAGSINTNAIFANDTRIDETMEASSSTDALSIFFNHRINKETIGNMVLCEKDGEEVASEISVFDNKVQINLKESLKDDAVYTISICYVEDFMSKSSIENYAFDFETRCGEAIAGGKITLTDLYVNYEDITIKGNIVSSKGIPIMNKKVFADVAGVTKVAETLSDENGEFTITYTLSEEIESGAVDIVVYSDHYQENAEKAILYVEKGLETEILEAISGAVLPEEVGRVFQNNETSLGINIRLDTLPVSDKNLVYRHMVGITYSNISELLSAYYSFAGMEDVNCATTARHINAVLSNQGICAALEIDIEKVNALSSANKMEFNSRFIDWPEEFTDIDTVKKAFKDTVKEFLLLEFGKTNASLIGSVHSAYVGEVIEHEIRLREPLDDVKYIFLELTTNNADILTDCEFQNLSGFSQTTELSEGNLKIKLETDSAISCEVLGKLILRTKSEGSAMINLSGELAYDVGEEFLVDASVEESNIDVTVIRNRPSGGSSGGGGSSTSFPSAGSSGGSGGSAGVTQRPLENQEPEKEPEDEPTKEPEKEMFKFNDMSNYEWAEEAVTELLRLDVISESEDKNFNPSKNITREEFVKLVVCALGIETEEKISGFSDVAEGAWYYKYIAAAEKAGIVNGDGKSFGIGTFITREDMATILYRAVSSKLSSNSESDIFADNDMISDYAKEAVYAMRNSGIINGVGENNFMPKSNATRAESAKMIYELIKAVKS